MPYVPPPASPGVSNPLTSDLNAGGNSITNVGGISDNNAHEIADGTKVGDLGGGNYFDLNDNELYVGNAQTSDPSVTSQVWNAGGLLVLSGYTAVPDGTYTIGLGVTNNGTITTRNGIITAIQEAS